MKFSVVTPSLNQAPFLERAIRSVLEQDHPDVEYVVIDGGSTDGSVDIIRHHARHLAGWVSEPDAGQADAIAKGFARCTGDVLAWLNSSDEFAPGAFRRAAAEFERGAEFVYGDCAIIDEQGGEPDIERVPCLDVDAMVYEGIVPGQPACFWTRRAYDRCGGVDRGLHYLMDVDLVIRLARTSRAAYVPAVLGRLRRHAGAKLERYSDAWYRERRRLLRKHGAGVPRLRQALSFTKRVGRLTRTGERYEAWKLVRRLIGWRGAP